MLIEGKPAIYNYMKDAKTQHIALRAREKGKVYSLKVSAFTNVLILMRNAICLNSRHVLL
jgi:hypothetical protein